jgi:tripartite-type tricarboxylate transporter receptor subunit TctC
MRYSVDHQKRFREKALRHATAAIAAFLTVLTLLSRRAAAEWPDKPVRVIVPYVAGGANDLLGRVFAEQLSKAFGQQFFVENRTGGGGLIGTEAVARTAPDGSTLIISGMPSHVLAPAMNKNASFDRSRISPTSPISADRSTCSWCIRRQA